MAEVEESHDLQPLVWHVDIAKVEFTRVVLLERVGEEAAGSENGGRKARAAWCVSRGARRLKEQQEQEEAAAGGGGKKRREEEEEEASEDS